MMHLSLHTGMMPLAAKTDVAATTGASAPEKWSPARKELHQAANEFEAMLLTSLWKSFKDTSLGDSDSDSGDVGGKTYESLGLQAMASAVAEGGGFGIGRMIEKQLSPDLKLNPSNSTHLPPLPSIE